MSLLLLGLKLCLVLMLQMMLFNSSIVSAGLLSIADDYDDGLCRANYKKWISVFKFKLKCVLCSISCVVKRMPYLQ